MTYLGKRTILVVEPNAAAARSIVALLGDRHEVVTAPTARAARAWLREAAPDVVIMELALPDADGLLFVSETKARTDAALLVHTQRASMRDLLLSLRLGADDFLAKPADLAELEARVGALLRRRVKSERGARAIREGGPAGLGTPVGHGATGGNAAATADGEQRLGDLASDRERSRVTVAGHHLYLTQTEFRLLSVLARRVGEPLSRAELSELIGGYEYIAGTRSVDMHVRRLRAKLRAAPGRVPAISSLRGYGYRMMGVPEGARSGEGRRANPAA